MSRRDKVRISVTHGLQALGRWYGVIGFVAALSALINLLVALFTLDLAAFLAPFITVYRAIAHPVIDTLTFWLPFRLPLFVKDIIVLYGIIGGSVARTNESFRDVRKGTLKHAWISLLAKPNPPGRNLYDPKEWALIRFYRAGPSWLRIVLDIIFWPITIGEVFAAPIASKGVLESGGAWYSRSSDWEKADGPSREGHIATFDLRINFAVQIIALIIIAFVIVGLNSYALPPG